MKASFGRIVALFEADLRTLARDRVGLVAGVGFLVLAGALGPLGPGIMERLLPDGTEESGAASAWDCKPGEMGAVATAGVLPPWLVWPERLVAGEDAEILIRPGRSGDGDSPDELELVELVETTHRRAVSDCLWSLVRAERRFRLDALGITEDRGDLTRMRTLPPGPPGRAAGHLPIAPLTVIGGIAMAMMSVFVELGPSARQSGWLETYAVLPGRRRDLVIAWWLVGLFAAMVATALVLTGAAGAAMTNGAEGGAVPLLLLPPLFAVSAAVGVRAFADVADVRTAMVQAMPVILGVFLSAGIAAMLETHASGLGGLVPLGGLLLAMAGATDGVALAVVTSLAGAGVLLWDAARTLDGIVLRQGAAGQTSSRRASGDYLPEVAFLVFVAMAGVGGWSPPERLVESAPVRTALGLALFLALPAILVSVPLRLDRVQLLSLRAPGARVWLVLPCLVMATLALAGEVWRLTLSVAGDSASVDVYTDALRQFEGGWGLVALSVAPGICEELLFRGAMLGLLRHKLPVWAAIALQAAAFAVVHGLAVRLPYTFVLGLVFGVLVVRARSLWPAIVAHIAHNLLAVLWPEVSAALPPALAWGIALFGLAVAWWGTRSAPGPR